MIPADDNRKKILTKCDGCGKIDTTEKKAIGDKLYHDKKCYDKRVKK